MNHKDYIEGYEGSLEDLANAVKDLKYNSLKEFLGYLADGIKGDAEADSSRGRYQLARKLYRTSESLYESRNFISRVAEICENKNSEHKNNIDSYNEPLEDLANGIKDLRYDSLRDFLGYLADGIKWDVDKNSNKGRYQLARILDITVGSLQDAENFIDLAWDICEPKIK
jgi:hypothetical protein